MTDKRTGLGSSLLFRRTAPLPPQENTEIPQISETPFRESAREPEPVASLVVPIKKPPQPLRDRCTLYLEPEVNRQLELVARIESKQRSEVVTEILRENLPKYRINREGD